MRAGLASGLSSYYDSFLPADLSRPARRSLGEIVKPSGAPKMRVVYFLGCASNVFAAKTVLASVALMAKQGIKVLIPKVGCCGESHRSAGDRLEARRLARKNAPLIFWSEADLIVTDCSTCAASLTHCEKVLGDCPEADLVRPKAGKVVELATLAAERLDIAKLSLRPVRISSITYHVPCYGVRGLGVKAAPRAVLSAIPDLELREMEKAGSCCGGAGSYGFTHPEMSSLIASSKAKFIPESQAQAVAASCPACSLQLGAGLRRVGLSNPVAHPMALLAKAAGIEGI